MQANREFAARWPEIRLPLTLSNEVVHVVRLNLAESAGDWSGLTDLLTDEERERAARYRFDSPRRRFTICRAVLRQLLGACCELNPLAVPLICANHGKPELALGAQAAHKPRVEFNVSHSEDYGLIAVTLDSAVGIDVEECSPRVQAAELAKRYFSPSEVEELFGLPAEYLRAGFFRGWTCKEAYIKATGRGLSLSLSSFCVTIDPRQPAALCHVDDCPDEPARWTIQALDVARGYAAAVMVARPDCRIACWDWPVA